MGTCALCSNDTPVRVDLLGNLRAQIANRNSYGIRQYTVAKKGYVLAWSNAYAAWYLEEGVIQPGTSIKLDANNVYAPGSRAEVIAVLKHLPPLPLYRHSSEGLSGVLDMPIPLWGIGVALAGLGAVLAAIWYYKKPAQVFQTDGPLQVPIINKPPVSVATQYKCQGKRCGGSSIPKSAPVPAGWMPVQPSIVPLTFDVPTVAVSAHKNQAVQAPTKEFKK